MNDDERDVNMIQHHSITTTATGTTTIDRSIDDPSRSAQLEPRTPSRLAITSDPVLRSNSIDRFIHSTHGDRSDTIQPDDRIEHVRYTTSLSFHRQTITNTTINWSMAFNHGRTGSGTGTICRSIDLGGAAARRRCDRCSSRHDTNARHACVRWGTTIWA